MTLFELADDTKIPLTFQLNGLRFRFKKEDDDFPTSKSTIILYRSDGGIINPFYRPLKEVKLSSQSATDIHMWAKTLSRVIVSFNLFF